MSQAVAEMLPPPSPHAPSGRVTVVDDPLALAALLEANGVSDLVARHYGASDVFDLAGRLRHQADHPLWQTLAGQRPPPATRLTARPADARMLLLYGPVLALLMIIGLIQLGWAWTTLRVLGVPAQAFLSGLVVGSVLSSAVLQALSWRAGMAISQQAVQLVPPLLGFHLRGALLAWLLGAAVTLAWPLTWGTKLGLLIASALIMALVVPSGCLVIIKRPVWAVLALGGPFVLAWLGRLALAEPLRLALPWSCWATQVVVLLLGLRHQHARWSFGATLPPPLAPRAMLFGALPYLLTGALPPLYVGLAQMLAWASVQAGASAGTALPAAHWLGMLGVALAQGVGEQAMRSLWPALGASNQRALSRPMTVALVARLVSVGAALTLSGLATLTLHATLLRLWPPLATVLPRGDALLLGMLCYSCFGLGLFACLVPIALARPGLAGLALSLAGLSQLAVYLWIEQPLHSGGLLGLGVCGATLLVAALGVWAYLIRRAEYTLYRAF
ncbi:hypothetical protein [Kallotenue papyrolyticum]|uniref:hypothetical protein n=1 Tax=Kallotenue papyrolyticum TaxID=1325125 RepID=UPI000478674E|nr:hypothetical protein [Kallotenue papyrolyticum]